MTPAISFIVESNNRPNIRLFITTTSHNLLLEETINKISFGGSNLQFYCLSNLYLSNTEEIS